MIYYPLLTDNGYASNKNAKFFFQLTDRQNHNPRLENESCSVFHPSLDGPVPRYDPYRNFKIVQKRIFSVTPLEHLLCTHHVWCLMMSCVSVTGEALRCNFCYSKGGGLCTATSVQTCAGLTNACGAVILPAPFCESSVRPCVVFFVVFFPLIYCLRIQKARMHVQYCTANLLCVWILPQGPQAG